MAGRVENLKPKTSAKERGKLGGIKSGKAKRIKKLMSEIYADVLADQSRIKSGKGLPAVIEEILNKRDIRTTSARVALMRELREGTEGSKIKTETVLTINADDEKVAAVLKEYGVNKTDPKD
jgi:hypothetical protein